MSDPKKDLEDLKSKVILLTDTLKFSALRWTDLATVIRLTGKYDNAAFCEASGRRCMEAIEDFAKMKSLPNQKDESVQNITKHEFFVAAALQGRCSGFLPLDHLPQERAMPARHTV